MINSLRKNIGDDVADEFEETYPLSKAANIEKKYEWAKKVFLKKYFKKKSKSHYWKASKPVVRDV